ncbi:MAG: NAD-dependent epimerase/dehydratase family protein [Oscillospiraceae bacterium]|nr:NAD-dependent epimerase/dehydratase family protein [Oscillospiraceae bacterium]
MLECFNDCVMQEDLEEVANDQTLLNLLKQKTIFVTGATGLIGSQVVKALCIMNRLHQAGIKVIALCRSEEKARSVFGPLLEWGDLSLCLGDVSQPIQVNANIDYILHGASPTSSKFFVTHPVETIRTAIDGTANVLELARAKQVQGFLYLSSLEVYGTVEPDAGFISEDHYGYLDPLSVRSSYSEGKRMVECLCVSYGQQYGVPVKIARLSQTFGAGVDYHDGRVFAEFARCAMEGKDIVLHTKGRTVRTYCYTKDAVSALLYLLTKGETGNAYNVTNMDTAISIWEMAELVRDTFPEANIQVTCDMPEDISAFGYNPEMIIKLSSEKLQSLGWKATVGLEEMYRRMIRSMAQSQTKN